MKGIKLILGIMILSILVALAWDKLPIIKNSVHAGLDPTFGWLLDLNLLVGMIILVFIINLILTIVHKYTTDQEELKKMKEETKKRQEEMRNFKDQPDKMMELQKKQMADLSSNLSKNFQLTMKPLIYTAIPIILFFRWFGDYFIAKGNPKILLGFFGWFGTYLILSIFFSTLLRKIMKVH